MLVIHCKIHHGESFTSHEQHGIIVNSKCTSTIPLRSSSALRKMHNSYIFSVLKSSYVYLFLTSYKCRKTYQAMLLIKYIDEVKI